MFVSSGSDPKDKEHGRRVHEEQESGKDACWYQHGRPSGTTRVRRPAALRRAAILPLKRHLLPPPWGMYTPPRGSQTRSNPPRLILLPCKEPVPPSGTPGTQLFEAVRAVAATAHMPPG